MTALLIILVIALTATAVRLIYAGAEKLADARWWAGAALVATGFLAAVGGGLLLGSGMEKMDPARQRLEALR